MGKFRKKPIVVEAEQFGGFYATPYPPGVEMEDNGNHPEKLKKHGRYAFYVVTAHGQRVYIQPDDWVIAEPNGQGHYSCKPDVFKATYEKVD